MTKNPKSPVTFAVMTLVLEGLTKEIRQHVLLSMAAVQRVVHETLPGVGATIHAHAMNEIAKRDETITDLTKLVDELKARIETLEARPSVEYTGPHKADTRYMKGQVCSWDGGCWFCKIDGNTLTPSYTADSGWQLMVKRGRDSREK